METDFKLYHIAKLYYIDKMKQSEIADIYDISTMLVSRLLKKAVEQGIVTISVKQPINIDTNLGQKLMKRFPLIKECLVAQEETAGYSPRRQIGQLAAQYVAGVLKDGNIIGISWGKAIYEFVLAMPTVSMPNCQVIQLKGGFLNLNNHLLVPANLVRIMGEKLSCSSLYLNAPLFVANSEIREQLEQDSSNSHLLKLAENADINVFGASALGTASTMANMGVLSKDDVEELEALKSLGDVDGCFINAAGDEVFWSKSDCCIGVRLSVVSKARHAVCLASGEEKAAVCKVALEKGLFNVFITTSDLAGKILALGD